MSTATEQIDVWRSAPTEDQHLEFKEAKVQFDYDRLCRYCVAIANEGGGALLLGIADQLPHPVVGTAAINNPVGMAAKLFQTLHFRVDVEEVSHPDGRVVVFNIPSRLRGTAYQLEGAYFMRSGEQLVPMSEDQLRRIFAEGTPNWLEEPSVSGLNAQQVIELLDTQMFFELLRLPYPTDQKGVLDRLLQERLVGIQGGGLIIYRLGALLLARHLQDFPDLARKTPRIVAYAGRSKLETRLDISTSRGYAVGFQDLMQSVTSQIPQNEAIQESLRSENKLVSDVTIRELLANALIHQDFGMSGMSVMVEIYVDRVEISNPGEPIVPIEHFIDSYRSRNERLADLMRRMFICEEKSSGIDRVIHEAETFQQPAPDFRTSVGRTTVIVFGTRPFDDMNRNDRVRACYQHCTLKYVIGTYMTNQSLRQRFYLPETKIAVVSQIIAATIDSGQIKLDQTMGTSRKYARYIPNWA